MEKDEEEGGYAEVVQRNAQWKDGTFVFSINKCGKNIVWLKLPLILAGVHVDIFAAFKKIYIFSIYRKYISSLLYKQCWTLELPNVLGFIMSYVGEVQRMWIVDAEK